MHRSIVGLVDPEHISYEDVETLAVASNEEVVKYLVEHEFVTQAREVQVLSLDDKVDFPIGVFYGGNKGGEVHIQSLFVRIINVTERCLNCHKEDTNCVFYCENCFANKEVDKICSEAGYVNWHPLLRPCEACL